MEQARNGDSARMALHDWYGLTRRESDVALCLGEGLSHAEIAESLGVSYHTICSHVKSILQKTESQSSRRVAALVAKIGQKRAPTENRQERGVWYEPG